MNNVTIKIDSKTVKGLMEAYVNQAMLHAKARAKATSINSSFAPNAEAGQPSMEISVTFDVIQIDG
jgi:hypothetical protein